MDEELKEYLGQMEGRLGQMEERTASLIAAEVGSLHSEIGELRSETRGALARIDERLDRQGFMLAGGTKALGGLLEHVVSVETNYSRVISEMSELRARVDRVEKKAS